MSWFSKKLKKVTKVLDPVGAKLRKSTGGSYGDPMNWYQSKPKQATPYVRPEKPGLQADPGTGGPTMNLGSTAGYTPNPFAGQMAQANALRGSPQTQPNMGVPMAQNMAMPGPITNVGITPQPGSTQPQGMQNTMLRGGRPPGMMF